MDETAAYFRNPDNFSLLACSDLAYANHQFQESHDHIWIMSLSYYRYQYLVKSTKCQVVNQLVSLTDFSSLIWQPPRIARYI